MLIYLLLVKSFFNPPICPDNYIHHLDLILFPLYNKYKCYFHLIYVYKIFLVLSFSIHHNLTNNYSLFIYCFLNYDVWKTTEPEKSCQHKLNENNICIYCKEEIKSIQDDEYNYQDILED